MSARARLAISIGGAVPVALLAAHGCKGATQVTVDVRTNVVCADMRGVDIFTAAEPRRAEERAGLVNGGARFPSASTNECAEGPAPRRVGTLVVTPGSGGAAIVVVTAFGSARLDDCVAPNFAPQCIVARRRVAFIDNRQLTVPIVLDPECAGVPCNESSTCVGKQCVDSTVKCEGDVCSDPGVGDDGGLLVVDGSSPFIDATTPPGDSGGPDAGDDSGGVKDAGDGGGNDAGKNDGGGQLCPSVSPTCLGNPALSCDDGWCCYANDLKSCASSANACAGNFACCRGSDDCSNGDICCASTATYTTTTRIDCRPFSECNAIGGRAVCTSQAKGCPLAYPCQETATPYSTEPQYFTCS